jgi:peptide-methionine (S)-S-oxide reductase
LSLAAFAGAAIRSPSLLAAAVKVPDPIIDEPLAPASWDRIAVLAGGCFWGVEAVFEHVQGVKDVRSGYSGGSASTAEYEMVSSGRTGHAETVRIVYDSARISYGQLLKVFFSVAHNPTELNRQGPDVGSQYRSLIFVADDEQERVAKAYVDQLNKAKVFRHRVVTEIVRLTAFYEAEAYHQDFVARFPNHSYVLFNDLPKLTSLRRQYPELYVEKRKK